MCSIVNGLSKAMQTRVYPSKPSLKIFKTKIKIKKKKKKITKWRYQWLHAAGGHISQILPMEATKQTMTFKGKSPKSRVAIC